MSESRNFTRKEFDKQMIYLIKCSCRLARLIQKAGTHDNEISKEKLAKKVIDERLSEILVYKIKKLQDIDNQIHTLEESIKSKSEQSDNPIDVEKDKKLRNDLMKLAGLGRESRRIKKARGLIERCISK